MDCVGGVVDLDLVSVMGFYLVLAAAAASCKIYAHEMKLIDKGKMREDRVSYLGSS